MKAHAPQADSIASCVILKMYLFVRNLNKFYALKVIKYKGRIPNN